MTDNPGRRAAEAPARTAPSPAPGRLRWIEELVNTRSVETGSDEIPTPALLGNWLRDRRLLPASRGTADTVLAALLAAVAESVASGTWDRLKICRNPDCRWAYYDQSRNLSRAWCSMAVCGNRAKARAFRSRSRQ